MKVYRYKGRPVNIYIYIYPHVFVCGIVSGRIFKKLISGTNWIEAESMYVMITFNVQQANLCKQKLWISKFEKIEGLVFYQYFLLSFFCSTWISISNTAISWLKLEVVLSKHCQYYTDWFEELLTGYMFILIPCPYSNSLRI